MTAPITAGWLCLLVGVVFTALWPKLLARYSSFRDHEGTEHLYAREYWTLIIGFYVIGLGLLIGGYLLQTKWQAAGVG